MLLLPIATRLGWPFPVLSRMNNPLSMQMHGQYRDDDIDLGNWQDHEFVQGTPVFAGWNAIDLKASPVFRVKFAYPTRVKVIWMIPSPLKGDQIISAKTMFFRKNQQFYYRPEKKAAWTAYPGASKIWMVQETPTKQRA